MKEFGYSCTAASPCFCSSTCGDGKKAFNEGCDDGTVDGLGCLNDCSGPASGYTCSGIDPTLCSFYCGNGINNTAGAYTEFCDDGDLTNGDGCSNACVVEAGWFCAGFPSDCSNCSDSRVVGTEVCDDGTNDGLGCTIGCSGITIGYSCSSGSPSSPSVCELDCGNSILDPDESCDNGAGIGCSDVCTIETGYTCKGSVGVASVCTPICGDGIILIGEDCDDLNTKDLDGCSSTCQIEDLSTDRCGDGEKSNDEECDDGNTEDGDGCSKLCKLELSES